MSIMHYLPRFDRSMDHFIRTILAGLPGERLETYTDFGFMRDRLEHDREKPKIMILCLEDEKKLCQMRQFSELFADIPSLVILPGKDAVAQHEASFLKSYHICSWEDCFADAPGVLSIIRTIFKGKIPAVISMPGIEYKH